MRQTIESGRRCTYKEDIASDVQPSDLVDQRIARRFEVAENANNDSGDATNGKIQANINVQHDSTVGSHLLK